MKNSITNINSLLANLARSVMSFSFVITFIAPCVAQTDSTTISLKECLSRGLKHNYDLQIVRLNQDIATTNVTRANAGQLPTISATAGYDADISSSESRNGNTKTSTSGILGHTLNASVRADWTLFDGFKMQANYKRLKELRTQSEIQTRIELEDFIASAATSYYNVVRQYVRMKNMRASLALSRERLRIVRERYQLGVASRLDFRSAEVDYNADSTLVLTQHESLINAIIDLQEMMGASANYYDGKGFLMLNPTDTIIPLLKTINVDSLEQNMLSTNARILKAASATRLSDIDYKAIVSRDYPYLKLAADYGYTHVTQETTPTTKRDNWGGGVGLTLGMKLFDGNRKRERHNAQVEIAKNELAQQDLELSLKAQLERLWKSYVNNQLLLSLAEENLKAAAEHHEAAQERFMLGNLSGIEMRQAEQNLLDARERLVDTQFSTKACEISLLNISGQVVKLTE